MVGYLKVFKVTLLLVFINQVNSFNFDYFMGYYCENQTIQNEKVFGCSRFSLRQSSMITFEAEHYVLSERKHIVFMLCNFGVVNWNFFKKFPNAINIYLSCTMSLRSSEFMYYTNSYVEKLEIVSSRVTHNKGSNAFHGLNALTELILLNSSIETPVLDDYLLIRNTNLKYLKIVNVKLAKIDNKAFQNNLKLKDVTIISTLIESLPDVVNFFPKSLVKLYLTNNKLMKINSNTFKGLENLKELNFCENQITQVDENVFEDLVNLEFLNLGRNKLTNLPNNLLKNNQKLNKLKLHVNNFKTLPPLEFFPKSLALVDLTENRFENIHSQYFDAHPNTKFEHDVIETRLRFDFPNFSNNYCVENKSENSVKCGDFKLRAFDLNNYGYFVKNAQKIILHNCNIEVLNDDFFRKFPDSQEMIFQNCSIRLKNSKAEVYSGSYALPSKIKKIEFDFCSFFENSNSNSFEKLPDLKIIKIRNTKSCENLYIDDNFFQNNSNIEILKFDDSGIEEFSPKLFKPLINLKILSLKNNSIDFLSNQVLDGMPSLLKLNLSYNKIENFRSYDLPKVQEIDLSRNSIKRLKQNAFYYMVDLEHLDLSCNHIESVSPRSFRNLKKLKTLNLSQNNIQYLSSDMFIDLMELNYLFLNENAFQNIDGILFRNNIHLKTLNFSQNDISSLPATESNFLPLSLTVLDLSCNKIPTIQKKHFENLRHLTDLKWDVNVLEV